MLNLFTGRIAILYFTITVHNWEQPQYLELVILMCLWGMHFVSKKKCLSCWVKICHSMLKGIILTVFDLLCMKCTVLRKEKHVQWINPYFCFISSTFSVDCLFKFTPFLLVSLKKRPAGISSSEAVSGTTEGGGGGGEVSRTNHTVLWSRVYSVLPKVNSPVYKPVFSFIFSWLWQVQWHKIRLRIYERKKIAFPLSL
jgi:hypothetical protein